MAKKLINKVRIEVPRNKDEELKLGGNIVDKEAILGDTSPLKDLDWAGKAATISDAKVHYSKYAELKKASEEELELCNNAMVGIDDLIKQSRDILKGVYRATPHTLGEWGFVVKETPSKPKKKAQ